MRDGVCFVALAAFVAAAGPARAQDDTIPYLGVAAQQLLTDEARGADDGIGFQLSLGVPLHGANALEVRVFDVGYERAIGGQDVQTGLFVDWVRTLGAVRAGLGGPITPFFVLGAGLVREDIRRNRNTHLGANAGAGILVPLGWRGLALRADARAQAQRNDRSAPGASSLLDYQLNLGLQLPLGGLAEPPVEVPPPVDCPLAVVDPGTGRTDCVADADADGVADASDECPGTRPGTAVDRRGCPPPPRGPGDGDGDRDGVPDARDQCPDTQPGLQVDAFGCVVAQTAVLRGVTFEPDSSRLTEEGRRTLDGVAATLRDQEQLKVEIAGHTDAIGSEAYNTLLSQQRADAVRTYLLVKGVSAERMVATGYGELEPVASNNTDEGRSANRRVEFRIAAE